MVQIEPVFIVYNNLNENLIPTIEILYLKKLG